MRQNLLAITVSKQEKYLAEALSSLRDELDILVVDDATPGMREFCQERKSELITKEKPKGLTDSWNKTFGYFRNKGYERCILSNDDVRFAKGFSVGLFQGLKQFDVVGPLTNQPGHQSKQRLPQCLLIKVNPENADKIQEELAKTYNNEPFEQLPYFNGFCFAFSKSIERFMFSDTLLFNPENINIGQETDLCNRMQENGGKVGLCKISYVFHWKGRIIATSLLETKREQLWRIV